MLFTHSREHILYKIFGDSFFVRHQIYCECYLYINIKVTYRNVLLKNEYLYANE